MPIVFRCPACAAELTLSDAAAGRRGKCPHCKGDIIVPSGTAPGAVTAGLPPQSARPQPNPGFTANPPSVLPAAAAPFPEMPFGSAPPLEPHRGTTIQVLGILSLFFLPVVLGPLAWIWGRQDLRKMADGKMDPAGKAATETGRICGMIASIISLGGLALTALIIVPMFCCCGAGLFAPRSPSAGVGALPGGGVNEEVNAELAAEEFLDDLKAGDFAAAHQKASKDFQNRHGVAGLRALVDKHPILKSFESRNTDTKRKTAGKFTLEASLKDGNDNTTTGTIDMVQEDGSWKVDRFTIP